MTETLPSCRVTLSGITELDNDILAFIIMRKEYVTNNQRIKRFKQQNTQQGEDCGKDIKTVLIPYKIL
jgi:hypothetical protein